MADHVQMLVDGEWIDIAAKSDVIFTPTPIVETSTPEMPDSKQSWSMKVDLAPDAAETLREVIEQAEREARAKRWQQRLWLRFPYR